MTKNERRLRPALLTGVAMIGLALGATAAQAEDIKVNGEDALGREDIEATLERHSQTASLLANAADVAMTRQTWTNAVPVNEREIDPQILIALPGTPTTARDPANITGVAQMFVDNGNGTIGLCTGSLINPRTVLFAAHCVNSRPATAYGANSGGVGIAFGFETNTRANAPGQTDELLVWLRGGANGAGRLQTNTANALYNVDFVAYNNLSLEPASRSFLYGDVAIAALDTPTRGIPTWSMLFSALPAPGQITAASGTGYRVSLAGYGGNGTGVSGTQPIDFRRRLAENWLGALTSLFNFETFLFGGSDPALRQNLYFIDFDDPARGTPAASRFDFNAFRDNALPNEGTTAGGDSGGPLILTNTFSRQLVIGVLSGGYTRFFGAQPANGYGTVSFYQPLYLYWDWIAANNPYRYVGARAGDGNWEDASRWVSLTDPNYFIIGPDGQVVNGVPTQLGEQKNGTSGQFGQACFQSGPTNECQDFRTNRLIVGNGPIGSDDNGFGANDNAGSAVIDGPGVATNQPATFDLTNSQPGAAALGGFDPVREPQNTALALPAPTIANGLPGATNFVPNNTAGNRVNGVLPRYFDVTLSNAGTTTLNSTVTIDRLTVAGAAGLTVAAGARLNSLIDITQRGGTITANGTLATPGDFILAAGLLQGTGTIATPFLTSIAGTVAPGTIGTLGTLSVNGNLILASANLTHIDVSGANSDRIAVTGAANVGGVVSVGTGIAGQVNGLGRQFTILSATGPVTGTFSAQNLSPILSQQFTYQQNAVLMTIRAASYNTVIDANNSVQRAYAQLLDQNRPNDALAGLYALDFTSVNTIRGTFNALAPVNEQAVRSLAAQTVNFLQNFNDTRLREADQDRAGGKIAITGRPLELAQMSINPMGQPLGGAVMALQDGAENTEMREANLPDNVAIYLSGGYVTGNVGELPGYSQNRDMEGYYIAGGVEYFPGESTMIGLSGFFSSLDADTPLAQRTESQSYAASVYARHRFEGGPIIDGQVSVGSVGFDTRRTVQYLANAQTLRSSTDNLMVSGALGISFDIETGIGTISPGLEARYANVDLETFREDGGTLALAMRRQNFRSTQSRFGFDYQVGGKGKFLTVNATAQMVLEFEEGPTVLFANFAQGVGPNAAFALREANSLWGEVGASATFGKGPFTITAGFDTTVGRSYADAQVARGSMTYRF